MTRTPLEIMEREGESRQPPAAGGGGGGGGGEGFKGGVILYHLDIQHPIHIGVHPSLLGSTPM